MTWCRPSAGLLFHATAIKTRFLNWQSSSSQHHSACNPTPSPPSLPVRRGLYISLAILSPILGRATATKNALKCRKETGCNNNPPPVRHKDTILRPEKASDHHLLVPHRRTQGLPALLVVCRLPGPSQPVPPQQAQNQKPEKRQQTNRHQWQAVKITRPLSLYHTFLPGRLWLVPPQPPLPAHWCKMGTGRDAPADQR